MAAGGIVLGSWEVRVTLVFRVEGVTKDQAAAVAINAPAVPAVVAAQHLRGIEVDVKAAGLEVVKPSGKQ
jgi:hypothetical protein